MVSFSGVPGLDETINYCGSKQSEITLDWRNLLSSVKSGTVSQSAHPSNMEIIVQ